jgi:hypothetical protein
MSAPVSNSSFSQFYAARAFLACPASSRGESRTGPTEGDPSLPEDEQATPEVDSPRTASDAEEEARWDADDRKDSRAWMGPGGHRSFNWSELDSPSPVSPHVDFRQDELVHGYDAEQDSPVHGFENQPSMLLAQATVDLAGVNANLNALQLQQPGVQTGHASLSVSTTPALPTQRTQVD